MDRLLTSHSCRGEVYKDHCALKQYRYLVYLNEDKKCEIIIKQNYLVVAISLIIKSKSASHDSSIAIAMFKYLYELCLLYSIIIYVNTKKTIINNNRDG